MKCPYPGCTADRPFDRVACPDHRVPCEPPWGTIERFPAPVVVPIKKGK